MKKVLIVVGIITVIVIILIVLVGVFATGTQKFTWNNQGYQYSLDYFNTGSVQSGTSELLDNNIVDDSRQVHVYARTTDAAIPTSCTNKESFSVTLKDTGKSALVCRVTGKSSETNQDVTVLYAMFVKDEGGKTHSLNLIAIPAHDISDMAADVPNIFSSFVIRKAQ